MVSLRPASHATRRWNTTQIVTSVLKLASRSRLGTVSDIVLLARNRATNRATVAFLINLSKIHGSYWWPTRRSLQPYLRGADGRERGRNALQGLAPELLLRCSLCFAIREQ